MDDELLGKKPFKGNSSDDENTEEVENYGQHEQEETAAEYDWPTTGAKVSS